MSVTELVTGTADNKNKADTAESCFATAVIAKASATASASFAGMQLPVTFGAAAVIQESVAYRSLCQPDSVGWSSCRVFSLPVSLLRRFRTLSRIAFLIRFSFDAGAGLSARGR